MNFTQGTLHGEPCEARIAKVYPRGPPAPCHVVTESRSEHFGFHDGLLVIWREECTVCHETSTTEGYDI